MLEPKLDSAFLYVSGREDRIQKLSSISQVSQSFNRYQSQVLAWISFTRDAKFSPYHDFNELLLYNTPGFLDQWIR